MCRTNCLGNAVPHRATMECTENGLGCSYWDAGSKSDASTGCKTEANCLSSSSKVQLAQQDIEYDTCLHDQEFDSTPGRLYVQQLYSGSHDMPATVRSSTIDWMVDAAMQLKLSSDSLFLAVQLYDKMLAAVFQEGPATAAAFLPSAKLPLAAITALWVAAKYEESVVPVATAFLQQLSPSNNNSLQQLLEAEAVLLAVVDHRLAKPTAKTFLRRYLQRLDVSRCLYFTAGYLLELALLDGGMLCYLPSTVAASAYVWALSLTGHACNDDHLCRLTGYSLTQILPCLLRLARVHTAACNTSKPCVISCKYLAVELEQVAALPPVGHEGLVQLEQGQEQEELLALVPDTPKARA